MKLLKTYNQIFENTNINNISVGYFVILKSPKHIPGFSKKQYSISEYFFKNNIGVITKINGGDIYVKYYNTPSLISSNLFNDDNEVIADNNDIMYYNKDLDILNNKHINIIKNKFI